MSDYMENIVPSHSLDDESVVIRDVRTDEFFQDNPSAQALRNRLYALAAVIGPILMAYGLTNQETFGLWVELFAVLIPTITSVIAWIWSRRNKAVVLSKKK